MLKRAVDRLAVYNKRCDSSSRGSVEEKKFAKLALAELILSIKLSILMMLDPFHILECIFQ